MNKLFLISVITLAVTAFGTATQQNIRTLRIEQKLNHFNDSDTRSWQMRYLASNDFFKPGGPLFIHVGGIGSISPDNIERGNHIYDMAREHNGYLFYTEHRFYGESIPDDAMTSENLQYFNVEQALADLAYFIRTMKKTHDGMANSKVILVGCAYGGSLATWFQKRYPGLATGSWASSAPLLAKADFYELKELTGKSIKQLGGEACYNRIQNGLAELDSMFVEKRGEEAKSALNLCHSFNESNNLDVSTLFYEISDLFVELVETHGYDEIQQGCSQIMESSSDLVGVANFIINRFPSNNCTDLSYNSYLSSYKNSPSKKEITSWTYQSCNELGWLQTSSSVNQPFGTKYPFEFFATLCADLFGQKFTSEYIKTNVLKTNQRFGGLKPDVENVYWTYGALDPWRALGIQTGELADVIPSISHCSDMGMITPFDYPKLKASKEKIAVLVRKWLS